MKMVLGIVVLLMLCSVAMGTSTEQYGTLIANLADTDIYWQEAEDVGQMTVLAPNGSIVSQHEQKFSILLFELWHMNEDFIEQYPNSDKMLTWYLADMEDITIGELADLAADCMEEPNSMRFVVRDVD